MIQLIEAVQDQLDKSREGLPKEDWELMEVNVHDIMTEHVDCMCGWLCNIIIERSDIAEIKEERLRDW